MPGLNIRWLTAVALLGVILLASVGTDPVLAHKTLHVATPPFPFTGSLDCPAPTASFDPATASKAELDFYGLPSRPTGSRSSISHWLDVVGHSRHRLCTAPIAGSVSSRPTPYSHTNNTDPFWSGIAVVNGGYNYAFSDWTVPCYSGGNYWTRQLQWIGLGSANIWQGGTETDWDQGYRFWYEAFPKIGIHYAGPPVGCGDHVAVQVDYNKTVANASYIYMSNYSNGQYWSTSYGNGFVPGSNQADWIVERTQCSGGAFALQQTGQTNWSYVQAESITVNNDALEPAGAFNYQVIAMWEGSTELAHTNGLGSDQKSFSVYFDNSGTSTAPLGC